MLHYIIYRKKTFTINGKGITQSFLNPELGLDP